MTDTTKLVAMLAVSEEALADARGFLDTWRAIDAAREAAKGERYNGVYQRGFYAGQQAAFGALVAFIRDGGHVGLPMSDDSLHMVGPSGMSFEVMSLLALRPWEPS